MPAVKGPITPALHRPEGSLRAPEYCRQKGAAGAVIGLVIVLTATAAWGVGASVRIAGAITLLEIFGLVLVLWATRDVWTTLPAQLPVLLPPADGAIRARIELMRDREEAE